MLDSDSARANSDELVSVILPTYNRASLLPRSISSVLEQSFENLELIVVDDGSRDQTADVVSSFEDKRVRYFPLKDNRGLPAARNAGLVEARGAYLAFQDSDDEWHREKLERQLQVFESHPAAAVVYSDMYRQNSDGRRMYLRSPDIAPGRLVNPDTRYWQTYMLAMQPALIRRSSIVETRFDESLALFEDLDFHLRVARRCAYVHLDEPLVTYYETQGLTTERMRERKARLQLLHKHARALFKENPGFLLREALGAMLGRSLMPIVRQHLVPL